MKIIKYILIIIFSIIAGSVISFYIMEKKYEVNLNVVQNGILEEVENFNSTTYSEEKKIISSFPIYSDWIKDKNENELRKFLYRYHLKTAEKIGIGPVRKDEDVKKFTDEGLLEKLDDANDYYYFYGVKKNFRFLTPQTKKLLEDVSEKFNEKLKSKNIEVSVKIAVSSALRTSKYQKQLLKRNVNAISESTHSYGTSFDIFYDDYFVVFEKKEEDSVKNTIHNKIRQRLGFVLGDSLRRQFHAVLAETLLEMQRDGVLYAINEKNQRCFHVSIQVP